MPETIYTTKEAIMRRASEVIGIPFGQIDPTGEHLRQGKGGVGTMIEECWFDITPNSEPVPDFTEAGVELKATPYVIGARGQISAKERLVCNIINYMEEYSKTFETSAFWHKCNTMLIMSYRHIQGVPKTDFTIDATVLFSFPEEDLIIVAQDWETIMNKVRAGRAHELSEGDTLYLAACTKGANANTVRQQPFSDIPAKQRAYSLKGGYMTRILRRFIYGDEQNPRIIRDWHELQEQTFEEYIVNKVSPFYGKTQAELKQQFGITGNSKSLNDRLLAKMLDINGRISDTEEFQSAGIITKTIRVQYNGNIKENMSFPTFDFIELSNEEIWEESELYNYLAPTKFMFVIFKQRADGEYAFERVMFWNIPNDDLEQVRLVWQRTRDTIRNGVELIPTTRGISNNLPKQSENPVSHVRPHGKDGSDKLPLPDGRMMTKQCFWLNNSYIKQQIEK